VSSDKRWTKTVCAKHLPRLFFNKTEGTKRGMNAEAPAK